MAMAVETVATAPKTATHLRPWQFKPGHAPSGGRPKGSRDAHTIYLESLPLKARQWVKSTNPAVLIDARKIALPLEEDAASASPARILIFIGDGALLPRNLSDAADDSQRRGIEAQSSVLSVAAPSASSLSAPTVSP